SAIAFTAAAGAAGPARAFALPAAAFGPDYAGTATLTGPCATGCTRNATAWWARGKETLTLPR
ncbi:MAG: hypothetical protein RQ752_08605, partial [Thermohalobaculum sp.]|nr:hypothetical protein [Thermohalobaculum sp.]